MNTKSILKNYRKEHSGHILQIIFLAVLAFALRVAGPVFLKLLLDIIKSGETSGGLWMLLGAGLSFVFAFVVEGLYQKESTKMAVDVTAYLRSSLFANLLKADYYDVCCNIDEIKETLLEETEDIGIKHIQKQVLPLIYHGTLLFGYLLLLLVFDGIFALIVFIILPLFFLLYKYMAKQFKKKSMKFKENDAMHEVLLTNKLRQLKDIKTRNGISKEEGDYIQTINKYKHKYIQSVMAQANLDVFLGAAFTLVAWVAAMLRYVIPYFNASLNVSLGEMVACIVIVPVMALSIKVLLRIDYKDLSRASSYEKLDKILAIRGEARLETVPSLEEIHNLKFENVSFDYRQLGIDNKLRLDKISFEVKRGEKLGIIGLPDSGKTTIADLIVKIIRPKQGSISLNDCDINKLNTYYLRDIVSYVSKDSTLFQGSIEDNIIYPLSLDEYKYNEALNKCRLKDLLFSLPDRDATMISDLDLSESDREKILLANAVYKDSPIIVLDEATSKLDAATEDFIMNEFFKLKNKIMIVISARVATLAKCDKILILASGKAVEYGKTEDLLKTKSSAFAKMVLSARIHKKA